MKSSPFIVLSLQCLFFIFSPIANVGTAQDLDNVTVSGRVIDQNGALIPGATVNVFLARTGISRTAQTDAQGSYRIIHLPPGNYTLRVTSAGFAPHETKDISAVAGQNLQIELRLFPQSLIAEPLTINANATTNVDITRTVVGSTILSHQIETLPVFTRSPLDLVFTVPGVSEEQLSTRDLAEDRNTIPATTPEEAGIFSLSGAPAYSNNLTIDGLDNNDDRAARERFQPSLEAIEEVQVITNQFSAEYGRASGGRVNIRTRSGSKDFRGRVFYFFRDEALNPDSLETTSETNQLLGMNIISNV